jgi:cell division septation protein DedD
VQRPNKSHRGNDDTALPAVEDDADDVARALRLQREQEAVIQATVAANASCGDAASLHIAGQLYACKVDALKERAKVAGIAPTAEGKELIQLTPEELNAWVAATLKPAEDKQGKEDKEV